MLAITMYLVAIVPIVGRWGLADRFDRRRRVARQNWASHLASRSDPTVSSIYARSRITAFGGSIRRRAACPRWREQADGVIGATAGPRSRPTSTSLMRFVSTAKGTCTASRCKTTSCDESMRSRSGSRPWQAPDAKASAATADQPTAAQLSSPHSIALHGRGGLLIADIGNHRIRRVDLAAGTIDTIAGNGEKVLPGDGQAAAGNPMWGPRAQFVAGDTLWISFAKDTACGPRASNQAW